jgi:rare lipoprotein A
MRSRANLLLALPLLLAAQAPDAGAPTGPRATSGDGEASAYDAVGYASVGESDDITAAHARLPIGSIAEVTSLDSGRIILVRIANRIAKGADGEIVLSRSAAQALGLRGDMDAVRVRSVQANATDAAALAAGGSAAPRLSAPDGLLRALRRTLPPLPAGDVVPLGGRSPARSSPAPVSSPPRVTAKTALEKPVATVPRLPPPPATSRGTLLVQIAALRDEQRARSLARGLRARVEGSGGWWRVRLGPFTDRVSAQRARDAAIARGYGDASIIPTP